MFLHILSPNCKFSNHDIVSKRLFEQNICTWIISSDCKCDDHLLNEQQRPQFTASFRNAGEYSHIPTGEEEEASKRNYSRGNYRHTIVKMEIKEQPCRINDEDTEEQIGWCFPSVSLITDEEH